jgi:hypothetical protein
MPTGTDVIAMPTAAQNAILARLAEQLETARHGERRAMVESAAALMNVGGQTVHRWLREGGFVYRPRKRRADAGHGAIGYDDAVKISAMLVQGYRENDKSVTTLTDTIDKCRRNGFARLERVDRKTGELIPVSATTVSRALRRYGLAPNEIRQAPPHQNLSSPHPNWCWQVDASVCILYYLPLAREGQGGYGLQRTEKWKHYKNRPGNLNAIEKCRVIRYVATDHASGVIRVRYYPHAESGQHTVAFLAWLMARKANPNDPFHGCPVNVMVDPGATASGIVRRFCDVLGIRLIVNKPHNPRAKGQVEQANNLWEMKFEGWLDHVRDRVENFNDLNVLAETFQVWFNETKTHTRTKKTRFAAWREITPSQLKITASEAQLLRLATGATATPRVAGDLTVRFEGEKWDVRHVPGIVIGRPLRVCLSPFEDNVALAEVEDADGTPVRFRLEALGEKSFGFPEGAPQIGLKYASPPDTLIERNRREIDRLITGESRVADAEAARRGRKCLPFHGAINPYIEAEQHAEAMKNVHPLPLPGTPMDAPAVDVVERRLSPVAAALRLREAMGEAWTNETYEWISRKYPEGIDAEALAQLIARWQQPSGGAIAAQP